MIARSEGREKKDSVNTYYVTCDSLTVPRRMREYSRNAGHQLKVFDHRLRARGAGLRQHEVSLQACFTLGAERDLERREAYRDAS